jgi:hypothetical protein
MAASAKRQFAFHTDPEFPKVNCPPEDAISSEAVFFILHPNDKPDEGGFSTSAQNKSFPNACECQRRSYSMFSEVNDIKNVLHATKRLLRYIYRGRVKPNHGVWKSTPSKNGSHHSFWRYEDVKMSEIFVERVN